MSVPVCEGCVSPCVCKVCPWVGGRCRAVRVPPPCLSVGVCVSLCGAASLCVCVCPWPYVLAHVYLHVCPCTRVCPRAGGVSAQGCLCPCGSACPRAGCGAVPRVFPGARVCAGTGGGCALVCVCCWCPCARRSAVCPVGVTVPRCHCEDHPALAWAPRRGCAVSVLGGFPDPAGPSHEQTGLSPQLIPLGAGGRTRDPPRGPLQC